MADIPAPNQSDQIRERAGRHAQAVRVILGVLEHFRHYPVGSGLGLRPRVDHGLVVVGHGAIGREHGGVGHAERVPLDEALALFRRQLRQERLLLGNELFGQDERRQVGVREVAVVVALLLAALRPHAVGLRVVQHGLRRHRAPALEHRDLAIPLHGERLLDVGERVDVLHLGLRAERGLTGAAHGDVRVHAQAPLLHVAVGDPRILEHLLEGEEVRAGLVGRPEIRSGDDLDERHAAAVQVDRRLLREAVVQRLPCILLDMQALNRSGGDPAVRRQVRQRPGGRERLLELRDLVALRQVGVEIVLAREDAARMHGAPQPQRRAYRELQRLLVRHRERPRQPEAHRANIAVGGGPERSRAAAEHFR